MYVEVLSDLVAIVAANDARETRTVYLVVAALGVIGVALVILAIWLVKQTQPERELLAPLERMNDRAWRKQEPAQMRRDLDEVRPTDARPVVREPDVPEVDDEFAQSRPALATFDDLQAQLAADVRPSPSVDPSPGADPLLAASADTDTDTDTGAEDDAVADGTVTHTTAGGSAEIAALAASAVASATDDTDDEQLAEDAERASTESAD